jgi:hypothetical protein
MSQNQKIELGQLIWTDFYERDSVHVAVIPVIAGEELKPGQRVCLKANTTDTVVADTGEPVGIVDPFLSPESQVKAEQKFWLFLFPGSILDLRHHWRHAAFDRAKCTEAERQESIAWLTKLADRDRQDYNELVSHVNFFIDFGDKYIQQDSESLRDTVYENSDLFWDHFERATGQLVSKKVRGDSPFCCSC